MPNIVFMKAFENIDTPTVVTLVQWCGDEDLQSNLQGQLPGVPLSTMSVEFGTGNAIFPAFTWGSDGASFTVPEFSIPSGGIPIASVTESGTEGFTIQIVTLEWLRLNGVIVAITP
jgi:hypothetical protein